MKRCKMGPAAEERRQDGGLDLWRMEEDAYVFEIMVLAEEWQY
jgi:hypothetical protein